ncbi:MAG TPA: hypothetical protein VKB50_16425, partial [Vicinamibacterales bacterium]|nr:hypothetical protein [Vicinamibacterales bacterium]
LHEMLTGTRAFEGDHAARVRVAILEDEPPRVSSLQPLAPAALDDLVHRGLAKNPDERWQSASEILRELTRISVALSPTRTHSWPVLRWIASLRNGEGRRARVIVSAMVLSSLVAAVMVYQLRPRDSANPLTSVAVLPSVNASGNSQHSSRAQPRDTANPQAYRSYLNGLFHHAKGTPDNVRAAIDDFQRALASDPGFALAWTGLSTGALTLAGDSIAHPVEPLATAHAAALKAVELDPTLADAHLLLGEIASSEWDWAGAEREYQRALELSPGLVRVHAAYAAHLAMTGRPRQALDVVPLIRRLDPMNTRLTGIEGHLLYLAGRFDESIELLRQSVDLGNANSLFFLAAAYDAKQQHHLAVDQYLALIHRFGDNPSNLVFLGYALARAGQREQATAILERVKTTAAYVSPAELAVLYVGLGDREGAFAALEDAYAARDLQLKWLKVEHHYDDLRDDPRFRDLERRVGL